MPALETLARRFSRRLGLDLFHAHEPAAGTRDGDRLIPGRIIAVRIAQATVERPAALGAAFREIAHTAFRTLDAERHRLRVFALGIRRARQKLAEASRLDHHRCAALLADLVGGPIGDLVLLDRPRVVALLRRVARTRDVRPEAAALHLEWRAALGAFLGIESREIVHLVNDLVDVHRFQRPIERNPELAEDGMPIEVALFDLVQLVFHVRGEPDLEDLRERPLQDLPDGLALWGRLEAPVLGGRIPPRAERRYDGRVSRRPPYPQALQFLHQARFAVARRRFGKVLAGHDLLERRSVALGKLRNGGEAVERLGVLDLVGLAVERVVAVEQDA